jgi:hypothetical protein
MPEEAPPPGTDCIVVECEQPAALYVRVSGTGELAGEASGIAMCDEHSAHWRDGDPG